MPRSIALSPDARLKIIYAPQLLLTTLAPFIQAIATRVEDTGNLTSSVLEATQAFPDCAKYFVIEPGQIEQTFGLRDELLYGDWLISRLLFCTSKGAKSVSLAGVPTEGLIELQMFLAECSSATQSREGILRHHGTFQQLLESLLALDILFETDDKAPALAPPATPGIFRLQHAGLLYRSKTTGILVDPHLHSMYNPGIANDIYRANLEGQVDGILISHFHEDHWFLSTLMTFPRDIPIIVPKVPRSSIICADMVNLLRRMGFQSVRSVDWYSEGIFIGDMEVHVLPFFGEQPLRFETGNCDIRNWGNTYVIRTQDFTSWFLIDSGADALGSMVDVAGYVKNQFGCVDFLLSNLRRFAISTPLYINGGLNWLTLSPSQIARFPSMREHCITLGPPGVAEICKVANARYYLPYAHWWGELGRAPNSIDIPGQDEPALINELAGSLKSVGARTEIVPWNIGEGFVANDGRFFQVCSPAICG